MSLEEFCIALHKLNLSQPRQGLSLLWLLDNQQPGAGYIPGEITSILREHGLGESHSTRLGEAIEKSGHVLKTGNRLRIKPTSRETVREWLATILVEPTPTADQANGFLPEAIWRGTFNYIERIAEQVNGCYEFGLYDGASVLIRKIVENLLIECYEHLKIDGQIKDSNGNYPMLNKIIAAAVDRDELKLGRDTKDTLREAKPLGDWSAHTRRYYAVKADLDKHQAKLRLAIQELLHVAGRK